MQPLISRSVSSLIILPPPTPPLSCRPSSVATTKRHRLAAPPADSDFSVMEAPRPRCLQMGFLVGPSWLALADGHLLRVLTCLQRRALGSFSSHNDSKPITGTLTRNTMKLGVRASPGEIGRHKHSIQSDYLPLLSCSFTPPNPAPIKVELKSELVGYPISSHWESPS